MIKGGHYIENNEISLSLQPKNIPIFNSVMLIVHKKHMEVDLFYAVLVTLDFTVV
jgi:hypothetical protein